MTDRPEATFERFSFVSPGGGAYRVRLLGEEVGNSASILLAGTGDVSSVDMAPGRYTAIIEPIGSEEITRQVLDLRAGERESIRLQDLGFEELDPVPRADRARQTVPSDAADASATLEPVRVAASATLRSSRPMRYGGGPEKRLSAADLHRRAFSAGLSVRHARDPDRLWRPSALSMSVNDRPSGDVAITVRRPPDWRQRPEWRLTVAVQDDPRWRMRIPLFTGGVQIVLTPTATPGGSDVIVGLAPRNSGRAALVSNLQTLFLGSAGDVVRSTLPAFRDGGRDDLISHLSECGEDPWTVAAAALLLAQSDELLPMASSMRRYAKRWPWLPDMTVLLAWIAARDERQGRERREAACLELLGAMPGRPYFAATQSLGLDLLTVLALGACQSDVRSAASSARERWARTSRRQVPTGVFLAAEDARIAKGVTLSRRNYETFVTGTIEPSQIEIAPRAQPQPSRGKVPALARSSMHPNDPWKGRFGGQYTREGFTLGASFSRGPESWVEVDLYVTGPGGDREVVEFFLHDSYHPERVKVAFENGRACYPVLAWGGFTLGAWLPKRGIELELDLSLLPDAPAVIRDY